MSLTLELQPEIEARLHAAAARRGMDVTQLAVELIEGGVSTQGGELSAAEFEAISDELADMNRDVQPLRPECYDRAYFYEDRI